MFSFFFKKIKSFCKFKTFPLTNAAECDKIIRVEKTLPNSVTVSTTDSDSVCLGSNPSSAAKKSNSHELDFFICADRHNIVCPKDNIISSKARTSLPLAAQMNAVEALPQMMLQQVENDVSLCPTVLRFAQTECNRLFGALIDS